MAVDTSTSIMYRLKEPKIQELGEEAPHDIILSFDTTTSMAPFIQKLRDDLQEFVTNIFKKHPDTKIAIIAQGDYCLTYDIKTLDFTTDIKKLQEFVRSVEDTNGGDYAECYELVLATAKQMGWREGNVIKQLIMFGDAYPHDFEDFPEILKDPKCPLAKRQLDWRDEADDLLQMGVSIFPVQYGKGLINKADQFWSELPYKTKSYLLEVKDPEEVRAVITVAIYKGKGTNCLQRYVKEITVHNDGKLPDSMQATLGRLEEIAGSSKAIALDTLSPPPAECVEETFMESGRRKATISADRIKRHVIVTKSAMVEAERRMAIQAELEEKARKIERLRLKQDKLGRKHERETEKLKEELRKNERIIGELQKKDVELQELDMEKEDVEYTLDMRKDELEEVAAEKERLKIYLEQKEKAEVDAEIERRNRHVSFLGKQLVAKRRVLVVKEELRKKTEEIERINGELQKKDVEIERRNRHVSFLRKQLVAKQAEVDQRDAELNEKESELQELDMEKEDVEYTLDMRKDELEEVAAEKERLKIYLELKEKAEVDAAIVKKELMTIDKDKQALNKTTTSTVLSGVYQGCIKVAIKTIKPRKSIGDKSLKQQMKLLLKCRHPNLVVVYGVEDPFTNSRSLTVVMDLAEKCLQKSNRLQMQVKTVQKILRDAANGLAYLHSIGVVHCAVKPSNILISGSVGKLSDVGFTSFTQGVRSQYTAPELEHNMDAKTHESDVYAMGVTILEAFCSKIQTVDQPLDLSSFRSHSKKRDLISQCVGNDPSERIKSDGISQKLNDMSET